MTLSHTFDREGGDERRGRRINGGGDGGGRRRRVRPMDEWLHDAMVVVMMINVIVVRGLAQVDRRSQTKEGGNKHLRRQVKQ